MAKALAALLAVGVAGGGYLVAVKPAHTHQVAMFGGRDDEDNPIDLVPLVPTRAQQLSKLRGSTPERPFDMLVIGGGGTGAGIALDAASRGIRTALIERDDFGSGTSSKSTKLVHGGVRYLEKAVFHLDYGQLKLVFEALQERKLILQNAAHLSHPLPIVTPCYQWWEVPYYWAGLKAYDLVAGMRSLVLSKYVGPAESLCMLPTLAKTHHDGSTLKGTVLYYDGQFDDARLNVALAVTAAAAGGIVANYVECQQLVKNDAGKVIGARCRDTVTGDVIDVYARVIINATGAFSDSVRGMSDPDAQKMILPSSGAHITLPSFYGSNVNGMIIPKTKDGRVVFMLPWQGSVIAGTTDTKCEVTPRPVPSSDEIDFILEALSDFLAIPVRREDVTSVWSGIRPLAVDPRAKDTANTSRDHVVHEETSGMLTVAGGKWTTYRRMAQDAVDAAVATGRLPMKAGPCRSDSLPLVGAKDYRPTLHAEIMQQCPGMDEPVARHLAKSYGDRYGRVLAVAQEKPAVLGRRLVPELPILEAEVPYCCRHEYCVGVEDFLARRTRAAFLDATAAVKAVPRVAELMAEELGWSSERKQREMAAGLKAVQQFLPPPAPSAPPPAVPQQAAAR